MNKVGVLAIIIIITLFSCCAKQEIVQSQDDQKGSELGRIEIVESFPGNGRIKFTYKLKDENTSRLNIAWKQEMDTSITVTIPGKDLTEVYEVILGDVNKLAEGEFKFTFTGLGDNGSKSMRVTKTAKIYGQKYIESLKNRTIINQVRDDKQLKLQFEKSVRPTEVGLKIRWTNLQGEVQSKKLSVEALNNWVELTNVNFEETISYSSMFKPQENALDSFYALESVVDIEEEIALVQVQKYNANRLFIKHGLQLSVWTGDEYTPGDGWSYDILPSDWQTMQFNSCHGFQSALLDAFPNMQWGNKMSPSGHLYKGEGAPLLPTYFQKKNGFIIGDRLNYLPQLSNIIFGDEEDYSEILVDQLEQWYPVARTHYPDAIVQNNQYGPQWTEDQLTTYAQRCKPDVLTYDTYFLGEDNYGIFINGTAERLAKYRNVTLKGLEGMQDNIPAFGQYTQGWLNGFIITESQLRAYYWMTWVYGGKWQSFFRLKQRDGDSMLLKNGIPGNYHNYTWIIAACNNESQNIGDYLVRLQTSKITIDRGDAPYNYDVRDWSAESWTAATDNFISSIEHIVHNTTTKGDLFIGYYDIIPSDKNGDPGFFNNNDQFFMMMNPVHDRKKVMDADDNAQDLTLTIDFTNHTGKRLKMVDRQTGDLVTLSGEDLGNNRIRYTFSVPGGTGELMCLGN